MRINRLVLHRTKGLSGPLFQPVGGGSLVHGQGNAFGVGGPLAGPRVTSGSVIDTSTIQINFSQCVDIVDVAGVEFRVNEGSWVEVTSPVEISPIVWQFSVAPDIEAGDEVEWRYVGGSDSVVDCDEAADIGDQAVSVSNGLELEGEFVLLETGGAGVLLLEDGITSPDDGIALEIMS